MKIFPGVNGREGDETLNMLLIVTFGDILGNYSGLINEFIQFYNIYAFNPLNLSISIILPYYK